MAVPMMRVRKMWMRVHKRRVLMPVTVAGTRVDGVGMLVLVVFVVYMRMGMFEFLMDMFVFMSFG